MADVMLDLETMGTGPRAAIIAIGAVEFASESVDTSDSFYRFVDLQSSVRLGGEMDADTVRWWLQQSDEARSEFLGYGHELSLALTAFSGWLGKRGQLEEVRVWGNGAAFDNVILASAYRSAGLNQPWRHWNDRCYRTVKALRPDVKLQRVGTHHNALHDAESQARHLVEIMNAMRTGPALQG